MGFLVVREGSGSPGDAMGDRVVFVSVVPPTSYRINGSNIFIFPIEEQWVIGEEIKGLNIRHARPCFCFKD